MDAPVFRCGRDYDAKTLRRFLRSGEKYNTAAGHTTKNAMVWLCQYEVGRRTRRVVKKVIVFHDSPDAVSEDAGNAISECMQP